MKCSNDFFSDVKGKENQSLPKYLFFFKVRGRLWKASMGDNFVTCFLKLAVRTVVQNHAAFNCVILKEKLP